MAPPPPATTGPGVASGVMPPGPRAPSVSVVTVTSRPGSIDVTWGALRAQSFPDFEWVLCDGLFAWRAPEVAAFVDDERLRHVAAPAAGEGLWSLNRSHNEALRHCRGELVVSLQDYIWVEPDGIERFWSAHRRHGGRAFVTAITATYALPAPVEAPDGKVTIFARPWTGPPTERLRVDESRHRFPPGLSPATAFGWELNWAAAPLAGLLDVGGFAEDHDRRFYSCDNVTVAVVADRLGYRFLVDRDNACRALDHAAVFPRPRDWEERHGRRGGWDRWYRDWVARGCPPLGDLRGEGRGASAAPSARHRGPPS